MVAETPRIDAIEAKAESINITHISAQTTLLNRADEIELDLGEILSVGDSGLITIEDDSGNTRTKFIADVDLQMDITWAAGLTNSTDTPQILVNDAIVMRGTGRAQNRGMVTAHLRLNAGDFVTLDIFGAALLNNSAEFALSIVARPL